MEEEQKIENLSPLAQQHKKDCTLFSQGDKDRCCRFLQRYL